MRAYLIEFLKALEAEIPPPPNCHHTLGFAQYRGGTAVLEDKLALHINKGGVFCWLVLDDDDFKKEPRQLAEVCAEMAKHAPVWRPAGYVEPERIP